MEVYKRNMSYLKEKLPAVYQSLNAGKILTDKVEYIPQEDNFFISGNNYQVYMHSRYDQGREMKFLLGKVQGNVDTVILFGLGNGKTIGEIKLRFPELKHLIIVDPNPEPMLLLLHQREIAEFNNYFRNITFIINKTVHEAEDILEQVVKENNRLTVIAHLTYQIIYSGYYDALWQKIRSIIRIHAVNTMTHEAHREKWLINVWRNLKYDAADIGAFANISQGVPAILVSAGPSLNKNIHLLKQAKTRALIVAAGSAMTILDTHGIVPHFRVAIDPLVENKRIFEKVDSNACPLIYSNRLFYDILPHYQAARVHIAFRQEDFLEKYIFNKAEISGLSIRSGFSVANTAMDVLIKLGCAKIILVGQDLCYTGGKLHAKGAWDEQSERKQQTDEALDISGKRVFTSKPFLSMKQLFEYLIAGAAGTQFINATEGGLAIMGAPNKTMAEVMEQDLTVEYNFTAEIARVLGEQQEVLSERRRKINAAVDDIQVTVNELLARAERILHKIVEVERMVSRNVRKRTVRNELKTINALVEKQYNNDFFKEVVYPVFLNKFMIRGDKLLASQNEDENLAKEIELVRANVMELHEYLALNAKLILEYKGRQKLNIQFLARN